MTQTGFIGTGEIAVAMVRGLANRGHQMTISDRNTTTAAWLAELTGSQTGAEAYIVALFAGYLGGMPKDGQGRLLEALQGLSTEGGLNASLRQHMQKAGVLGDLRDGLDAFRPRLGLPAKDR